MQTIEETTIDKSTWQRGPWDTEPDKRQWRDEATGLPCLIVRHPTSGHLCGYVGVSKGHPLYEQSDGDVSVHGGITYASKCDEHRICHKVEPGEDDDVWWLGFDCAHSGDRSSLRVEGGRWGWPSEERYRDFNYVTHECQDLAKQLAAMAV